MTIEQGLYMTAALIAGVWIFLLKVKIRDLKEDVTYWQREHEKASEYRAEALLYREQWDASRVQAAYIEAPARRPYPLRLSPVSGYVYLIRDKNVTGYCKIGRTTRPKDRLTMFQVDLPFEVDTLAMIDTDNPTSLETELHHRYAPKRVRGEWFNLSDSDIEEIKALRGEEQ